MRAHAESATRPPHRAVSQPPPRRCFGGSFFGVAIDWLRRGGELRRQRRALLRLDDRLLRDIGLTRVQAEQPPRWPF